MNPRPLRCAIYARVSTDDGEQDPTQQLAPCRAEAARRGYAVVWEGCDHVSGTVELWNRPEGANLWKLIRNRAIDVVLCYDASRLSRESAPAVMGLIHSLSKRGVGFVSATEQILDTASDNDFKDVILAFVSWANHYYVRQLRRSVKRGMAAARAAGRPIGRHPVGCGLLHPCPTQTHDERGLPRKAPKYKGPPRKTAPSQPQGPPPDETPWKVNLP